MTGHTPDLKRRGDLASPGGPVAADP